MLLEKYSHNPRIDKLLENIVTELRSFTEEQAQKIADLAAIGKAMSSERDLPIVLELILSLARKFTRADAGTLYMLAPDRRELVFHVVHNDSLKSYMGGSSKEAITFPNVPLYDEKGNPNHGNVSAYVALQDETVNIEDVYEAQGFNFEGTKKFDSIFKYRSQSMLVVPMKNHEDEIIGVLQLINAKDVDSQNTILFGADVVDMAEALASQAAVLLTQQELINDLKNLFESFIRAIATAIEEKSKYTGGHIERVAKLTMYIAEKINESKVPPFDDVQFTPNQMDELRIAAWMHDTGKIITPKHVVDKANKLETVFDRIDLIRARWQAIRLSRCLAAEKAKVQLIEGKVDPEQLKKIDAECQSDLAELSKDFEFIEEINTGSEFLADEKIDQLNAIAQKIYDEDGTAYKYLQEDEAQNLSIRKGTLTDDEREMINNHALMTKKVLERLSWPQKLAQVPNIAAAHHEKLDGTGYPLGLKDNEINLQSRIMAIADIFDALAAIDRPYVHDPKPLSQIIKILGFMVKDRHIDKDVVAVFINSGLIFEYAEQYLAKDQIDISALDEKF